MTRGCALATMQVTKLVTCTGHCLQVLTCCVLTSHAGSINMEEPAEPVHAFGHWTHVRSKGRIMVSDLQVSQPAGASPVWQAIYLQIVQSKCSCLPRRSAECRMRCSSPTKLQL